MDRERDAADVVRVIAEGMSRLAAGGLAEADKEALLDRIAGVYAVDTVVRHPFAPFGDVPLGGRAEVRARYAHAAGHIGHSDSFEPGEIFVHQTADPELVVAEIRYVGLARGRRFELPSVFIIRLRDGLIVESDDYSDQIGVARAFGRLGELAKALAADAD